MPMPMPTIFLSSAHAVVECVLGALIDLNRGVSNSVLAYCAGHPPSGVWAASCAAPRWA